MAGPKQIPAPIDRPIARAYLREFTGLSTAFPPGMSDPSSLRIMENVIVNKDGSLRIRPGLRYMSYSDVLTGMVETPVGTHEAFYDNDGLKRYLFAVREDDGTVGFRVLDPYAEGFVDASTVFATPQGVAWDDDPALTGINFGPTCNYVKYLQIDNKIYALSDSDEPLRIFDVGTEKTAKIPISIERPDWTYQDKLSVYHPDAASILGNIASSRTNWINNPNMDSVLSWDVSSGTTMRSLDSSTSHTGTNSLKIQPGPSEKNLARYSLRSSGTVTTTDWKNWNDSNSALSVVSNGLVVTLLCTKIGACGFATNTVVNSPKVTAGESYAFSFDVEQISSSAKITTYVRWYGAADAYLGMSPKQEFGTTTGRKVSTPLVAPAGAQTMRVLIGVTATATTTARTMRFRNVRVSLASEISAGLLPYFSGSDGAGYAWEGATDASNSLKIVASALQVHSNRFTVVPGVDIAASLWAKSSNAGMDVRLGFSYHKADDSLITTVFDTNDTPGTSFTQSSFTDTPPALANYARLVIDMPSTAIDRAYWIDSAIAETDSVATGAFFDGDTTPTLTELYSWLGPVGNSASKEDTYSAPAALPVAGINATTLISSTASLNTYRFGFFYAFENQVGESAYSQVTVVRAQRPWQAWLWETPNLTEGDPSGTYTPEADGAADQLVARIPEDVFNAALLRKATSWNLYMLTWSADSPVPVEGIKIATVPLDENSTYIQSGWARMTPQHTDGIDNVIVPTVNNRYNYSAPSHAGQGLVAADRMVVVKSPAESAVIRWTSNKQGEYSNFSASEGGGYKTLTSGNLFLTACVKLWQNPQSVDTLTILCDGTDGHSTGYYMAPAEITGQSDATPIMGFEETTATPGTVSPYGVEVFNNSLYHPLDDQLMKSTASNYNINHKTLTDQIENKWLALINKHKIVSSQLDKRIYYLVHNGEGAPIEEGNNGNELWVFDAEAEAGTWSRFLIQGVSLRKIELDGIVYMSVITADGIFYLDWNATVDQYVADDGTVAERNIPWRFETNTQGANRAHDAWCHLKQLEINLGNFQGAMEWGIRSWTIDGKNLRKSKQTRDLNPVDDINALPFDITDFLQIDRQLQTWRLFANSVVDTEGVVQFSAGQINNVQYRYAPISVNTGTDYGSIETFEYTRSEVNWDDRTTDNGVPIPVIDVQRP